MDNTPTNNNTNFDSIIENYLENCLNSRLLMEEIENNEIPENINNAEDNGNEEIIFETNQEEETEPELETETELGDTENIPRVRITPLRDLNLIRNYPIISVMNQVFTFPNDNDDVLINSLNEKAAYKKVISEEKKNNLKEIKYKESCKTNDTCPIFQVKFSDEDNVVELPCKHCFTPDGIKKWLSEEQAVCPVCRFELESIEVKCKEDEEDRGGPGNSEISRSRQALIRSLANLANNNYVVTNGNVLYREEQDDLQQAIYESLQINNNNNNED